MKIKKILIVIFFLFWQVLLARADPGLYEDRIIIGTSLPLTGHAAYLGQAVLAGMQAYFHYINAQGGVYGRRIVLKVYDDAYTPPLMIGHIKRLIEKDKVFAILSPAGTPTTLTVVEICQNQRVPLLFPITGAIELRHPVKRYIFNLRPSYWDECRAGVDFFIKRGKKRFAVFYQRDAYGLNGLQGVERRLIKYDLEPVAKASYLRGVSKVSKQVREIMRACPEVVALIGTADVCAAFIKEAVSYRRAVSFFGVSFVGAKDLAKRRKDIKARVFMTQILPPYTDLSLLAVREYQKIFRKYFPSQPLTALSFEGFLNAKLFVYALKKAGPEVNRENLILMIEKFRNLDIGIGEKINFSETDHQGLNKVFIIQLKNGKISFITT